MITRSAHMIRSERRMGGIGAIVVSPWMLIDAALWAAMIIITLWLRFDFSVEQLTQSLEMARLYLVLCGLIIGSSIMGWLVGLYRGRFIPGSLLETAVLLAVFAGVSLGVFLVHVVSGSNDGVPRSTPIVASAFTVLACVVLRSLVRRRELFGAGVAKNRDPVIVFGAGDGGVQLVRQLRRSEVAQFKPVGILDDDQTKRHMVVDGVRVFGGRNDLEDLVAKTGAGTIIIAVPSLPADELITIRDRAEAAGLHVLVLPPLEVMMRGSVDVNELREINVNDLLGRKVARLNQTQIADYIRGKRILVTGAGGSIGSELCRQIVKFRPRELMMLDRDESGLHSVQLSLQEQAMLDGDDTILASIRDREPILEIIKRRQPDIIFHAAALKHMPLLEHYPLEALKTNVIGTKNLLDAAEKAGVKTFVNISTDKAANPCSALGESKRIAEMLTANHASLAVNSKYVSVRFGNVLGSRGSVLTVFERQINEGGPLTVTDPEVERYFMTIPEACQLVLQAAVIGKSGKTLVLDMGEPIKIAQVAKTLIEQSGKNIEVIYTGLRANEKLSEELFDCHETEKSLAEHESISEVEVQQFDLKLQEAHSLRSHEEARAWMRTVVGG